MRRRLFRLLAAIALLAPGAEAAAPRVEVRFIASDTFADVRDGYTPTPSARDFYLGNLRRYIEERAVARMADGEVLEVAITNVDLAGDYEARRPQTTDVRIVRDVYPARIDLRFRLYGDQGVTISSGERALRSNAYPAGVDTPYSTDPLRYEKALIDEWLAEDLRRP